MKLRQQLSGSLAHQASASDEQSSRAKLSDTSHSLPILANKIAPESAGSTSAEAAKTAKRRKLTARASVDSSSDLQLKQSQPDTGRLTELDLVVPLRVSGSQRASNDAQPKQAARSIISSPAPSSPGGSNCAGQKQFLLCAPGSANQFVVATAINSTSAPATSNAQLKSNANKDSNLAQLADQQPQHCLIGKSIIWPSTSTIDCNILISSAEKDKLAPSVRCHDHLVRPLEMQPQKSTQSSCANYNNYSAPSQAQYLAELPFQQQAQHSTPYNNQDEPYQANGNVYTSRPHIGAHNPTGSVILLVRNNNNNNSDRSSQTVHHYSLAANSHQQQQQHQQSQIMPTTSNLADISASNLLGAGDETAEDEAASLVSDLMMVNANTEDDKATTDELNSILDNSQLQHQHNQHHIQHLNHLNHNQNHHHHHHHQNNLNQQQQHNLVAYKRLTQTNPLSPVQSGSYFVSPNNANNNSSNNNSSNEQTTFSQSSFASNSSDNHRSYLHPQINQQHHLQHTEAHQHLVGDANNNNSNTSQASSNCQSQHSYTQQTNHSNNNYQPPNDGYYMLEGNQQASQEQQQQQNQHEQSNQINSQNLYVPTVFLYQNQHIQANNNSNKCNSQQNVNQSSSCDAESRQVVHELDEQTDKQIEQKLLDEDNKNNNNNNNSIDLDEDLIADSSSDFLSILPSISYLDNSYNSNMFASMSSSQSNSLISTSASSPPATLQGASTGATSTNTPKATNNSSGG